MNVELRIGLLNEKTWNSVGDCIDILVQFFCNRVGKCGLTTSVINFNHRVKFVLKVCKPDTAVKKSRALVSHSLTLEHVHNLRVPTQFFRIHSCAGFEMVVSPMSKLLGQRW